MEESKAVKYINKGYHLSHVKIQAGLSKADVEFRKISSECDLHTRFRYLVAKKLNVPEAISLMNKVSEWRKLNLPIKLSRGVMKELAKKKNRIGSLS